MSLGRKARDAEASLGRAVDTLVTRLVGSSPRQPLEILHALLEEIERSVQPAGRGTWVFPYNRLTAEFLTPTRESKAQLIGVLGNADALRARIVDKLKPNCRVGTLDVRLRYRAERGAHWTRPDFHLELDQVERTPAPATAQTTAAASIELTITNGVADRRRYSFSGDRIDIGRGAEVLDTKQRLLRRNQIAFNDEGNDANQTVSRRHAHVLYVTAAREYRVYDDNSARGTNIFRRGATIPVPPGSRGVALQTNDELILGQARLRVKIGAV